MKREYLGLLASSCNPSSDNLYNLNSMTLPLTMNLEQPDKNNGYIPLSPHCHPTIRYPPTYNLTVHIFSPEQTVACLSA
jgi:hypothetical protein